MTHPPPDPEGRRATTALRRLMEQHLHKRYHYCSARCPYCDQQFESERQETMQEAEAAVVMQAEHHAQTCTGRAVHVAMREERVRLADRLDAALAVKDAGEAVERAWALVRELRGEES